MAGARVPIHSGGPRVVPSIQSRPFCTPCSPTFPCPCPCSCPPRPKPPHEPAPGLCCHRLWNIQLGRGAAASRRQRAPDRVGAGAPHHAHRGVLPGRHPAAAVGARSLVWARGGGGLHRRCGWPPDAVDEKHPGLQPAGPKHRHRRRPRRQVPRRGGGLPAPFESPCRGRSRPRHQASRCGPTGVFCRRRTRARRPGARRTGGRCPASRFYGSALSIRTDCRRFGL